MKLKDLIGILSSYRTLVIYDYDTQDELKIYSACDIRIGSPYEDLDIRRSIERDRNICDEFGEFEVRLITCDHSCLYVDVEMGVIL